MTYNCQCPCGATRLTVQGKPISRFICHCTICQEKYEAPFADVTLFKLSAVESPANDAIVFGKYKRFGAVERGFCASCDKPILARTGSGQKDFAFIGTRNYLQPEQLPPAEMHVFYGTRVADVDDDLPKYSNGISSRYAFIKRLLKAG